MPQNVDLPPLASYKSTAVYNPRYADFIIWSGWFRTWYGLVNNFDSQTGVISVIFEGTPRLLVTLTEDEMINTTVLVRLSDIRNRKRGSWSIQQTINGQSIWYV